jgi:phospholipase/carboxylesterase
MQLDQWPPVEMVEELVSQCLSLPNVRAKQSRMASPESRALCLPDAFAAGPPSAFIDGHEFCHLHPPPEGSIHLTLPKDLRERAVHLGWAEQHPVARVGVMPETLVMVYAPRDYDELGTVLKLVWGSYQFAAGLI